MRATAFFGLLKAFGIDPEEIADQIANGAPCICGHSADSHEYNDGNHTCESECECSGFMPALQTETKTGDTHR